MVPELNKIIQFHSGHYPLPEKFLGNPATLQAASIDCRGRSSSPMPSRGRQGQRLLFMNVWIAQEVGRMNGGRIRPIRQQIATGPGQDPQPAWPQVTRP